MIFPTPDRLQRVLAMAGFYIERGLPHHPEVFSSSSFLAI
jgi:hypothetical protein